MRINGAPREERGGRDQSGTNSLEARASTRWRLRVRRWLRRLRCPFCRPRPGVYFSGPLDFFSYFENDRVPKKTEKYTPESGVFFLVFLSSGVYFFGLPCIPNRAERERERAPNPHQPTCNYFVNRAYLQHWPFCRKRSRRGGGGGAPVPLKNGLRKALSRRPYAPMPK